MAINIEVKAREYEGGKSESTHSLINRFFKLADRVGLMYRIKGKSFFIPKSRKKYNKKLVIKHLNKKNKEKLEKAKYRFPAQKAKKTNKKYKKPDFTYKKPVTYEKFGIYNKNDNERDL